MNLLYIYDIFINEDDRDGVRTRISRNVRIKVASHKATRHMLHVHEMMLDTVPVVKQTIMTPGD